MRGEVSEGMNDTLRRHAPDVTLSLHHTLMSNETMASLHFEADQNFRVADETLTREPEAMAHLVVSALDQMRRDAIVGLGMQDWEKRVREEERRKATKAAVALLRMIAEEGVRYAATTDKAALLVYDQANLVERDGLIRD